MSLERCLTSSAATVEVAAEKGADDVLIYLGAAAGEGLLTGTLCPRQLLAATAAEVTMVRGQQEPAVQRGWPLLQDLLAGLEGPLPASGRGGLIESQGRSGHGPLHKMRLCRVFHC